MPTGSDELGTRVRRLYDTYEILLDVWGENMHPGIYLDPGESIEAAAVRATERLAEGAGLQAGERVLETACGFGGSARYLARRFAVEVVGTNISEPQLAVARRLTDAERLESLVRFEYADFEQLPCPDGSFDCYWSQDSWLYGGDKERVVGEAHRVLKPGGRLAVSEFVERDPVSGELTRELTERLPAPGFWPVARYEEALLAAGFASVVIADWSQHSVQAFERMLARLDENEEAYLERHGRELVDLTRDRFQLWLRAFETRHLGWTAFHAERPA